MHHTVARNVLQKYLENGKIPSLEELGVSAHADAHTKSLAFVTVYRDGKIVASSGRVHIKRENTLLELVDNALACLQDPRLVGVLATPEDIEKVQFRVDIIRNEDRRIVQSHTDINPKEEGYIFLSQNLGKLAVLLPRITNIASTPDQLFDIVCQKAGVERQKLAPSDYVLYAIRSTATSDF